MNNYKHSPNPFEKISEQMSALFREFGDFLTAQAGTFEKEVRCAAREAIAPRGKFIRPILVFADRKSVV